MKKIPIISLMATCCCFMACLPETQPAYYLSPLDINANYYHAIPLRSDSVKAAVYTHFALTYGNANYGFKDALYGFNWGIHRSHNLGLVQAYYGAGVVLGGYSVGNYYRVNYPGQTYSGDTVTHISGGSRFYGAYGFNGGINIAIPSPFNGGEMRVGMETSFQHEFGDYLSFRRSIPESSIDILAMSGWTKTIGGYLEFLHKARRRNTVFGYKISAGGSLVSYDTYLGDKNINKPFYFSNTFHLSKGHVTGFVQFNFGPYSATTQTGINYRIGKMK